MRIALAYYILIAADALCPAQDSAMLHADQAFVQAVHRADGAALDRLLDDDFTWTDFEGKTQTKADVVQDVPKMPLRGDDNASLASYTYGNLGDVQENDGRVHLLRVWVKRAGEWKAMVYQEVSFLEAPPSFAPGAGKPPGCGRFLEVGDGRGGPQFGGVRPNGGG
jgi:hypothetical protein